MATLRTVSNTTEGLEGSLCKRLPGQTASEHAYSNSGLSPRTFAGRAQPADASKICRLPIASSEIQDLLGPFETLPRFFAAYRTAYETRGLGGIRETLNQLPAIIDALGNVKSAAVDSITRGIDPSSPGRLLNRALKRGDANSRSDGDTSPSGTTKLSRCSHQRLTTSCGSPISRLTNENALESRILKSNSTTHSATSLKLRKRPEPCTRQLHTKDDGKRERFVTES